MTHEEWILEKREKSNRLCDEIKKLVEYERTGRNEFMRCIIARTYGGAQDLYFGIPDLKNATIIDVINSNKDEYETKLVIQDVKGNIHNIIIAQA